MATRAQTNGPKTLRSRHDERAYLSALAADTEGPTVCAREWHSLAFVVDKHLARRCVAAAQLAMICGIMRCTELDGMGDE